MARIICDRHGSAPVHSVCIHLFDEIKLGKYSKGVLFKSGMFYTEVCASCYSEANLVEYDNRSLDEVISMPIEEGDKFLNEVEKRLEQTQPHYYCLPCFNEIRLKQARKEKLPDPFEAWENTLEFRDKETIDELCKALKENLPFTEDRKAVGKPKFNIHYGDIDWPFEVQIYYIFDESEQLRIIGIIDSFFENIEKKQRIVQFYEGERNRKRVRKYGYKPAENEEVLIKEVVIK